MSNLFLDSYFVKNHVILYITDKSDFFGTFPTTKSKTLITRNINLTYSNNQIDFDDISEVFPVCQISDDIKSFTIVNNAINIVHTDDRVMVPLDKDAIELVFKYQL